MKNSVYVIEGVDGCGKTTTCKVLAEKNSWKLVATPSGTFKDRINDIEGLNDNYLSFSYFLSSVFYSNLLIERAIKANKTVICDRYFPTLVVYSKAMSLDTSFINLNDLPLIAPNKIIHLYLDYEILVTRLKLKRELSLDEMKILNSKDFYKNLVSGYRSCCNEEVDISKLDPSEMVTKVEKLLK